MGPGDLILTGVEPLDQAQSGQITFVSSAKYAPSWPHCGATAALVSEGIDLEPGNGRAFIWVKSAELALADVLAIFAPALPRPEAGISTGAVVHHTAQIGPGAAIGTGCVVGEAVHIGPDTVLHPNVTVLDHCEIGSACILWSGCVVRERCRIGDGSILHPNVTIGSDGFGYRPMLESSGVARLVKIPHIGTVEIGRDVEIGSGSCVDRGKFSATVVGDGTKIDNLCQIAHNCQIGRGCVIAAQAAIGGSVTIGDGVRIAGMVAIKDHVKIGDGVTLAALSGVIGDVPAGVTWAGFPAREAGSVRRQWAALRKLPELTKILKQLGR